MSINYDKKLDSDKKLKKQAEHYDNADIKKEFDLTKAKAKKGKVKRINIIIPENIYLEAEMIGKITGAGYQNTLKTAMAIGLHQLIQQVS